MTMISPLLQNKLNNKNTSKGNSNLSNRHEKIYQDLQKRAHEAKPNEAKAVLVEEGILGNPITAVKDIAKDTKNFFSAIKTGKMGDNNLGRINDLGLKIGAALIATGLAIHSKTKTQSLMRFIGGATFIGAMSLWPKLFINLPARLVHGFRIDRKYISAQGDKKDFFLDNQFLVWDAYPEEQLRKDAKNAGIDYDAKNGKEKIQRKMQKTALQNRALWMATAGFATPLMTAMIGNYVEPVVKEAVINQEVKKVKKQIGAQGENLKQYLQGVKPEVRNEKELQNLLSNKGNVALDIDFFKEITETIFPEDLSKAFKDPDDVKSIKSFTPANFAEELKKIYEDLATINTRDLDIDDILKTGSNANKITGFSNLFENIESEVTSLDGSPIDLDSYKKAIQEALGEKASVSKVRDILLANEVASEKVEEILSSIKTDNKTFFEFLENYNKGPVAELRAKIKAYLNTMNPIIGSKDESLSTSTFKKTMKKVFKALGLDSAKEVNAIKGKETIKAIEHLSSIIGEKVKDLTPEKYEEFIQSLVADEIDDDIKKIIEALQDDANLAGIMPSAGTLDNVDIESLNKALIGGSEASDGILGNLKNFVKAKVADLDAVRTKAIIAANLERRIAAGEFSDDEIKIARNFVYDGSISKMITAARKDTVDPAKYKSVLDQIFDVSKFQDEKKIVPGIENLINNLKAIGSSEKSIVTPTVDYMSCGSFVEHVKKVAKDFSNNKAWMKIFAPMTIGLVAVTLLVQPLFGKIDKEFPEEGKNGGAK